MRRQAAIFLIICLALVLIVSVAAQGPPNRHIISINDISFDVTVSEVKILDNGNLALKLAATGSGITDCGIDQECIDAGLNGKTVNIQQGFDLKIIDGKKISKWYPGEEWIPFIGGNTAGRLQIVDSQTDPWGFQGSVEGFAVPGADPNLIDLRLSVKASGKNGAIFIMDLTGVFNRTTGLVDGMTAGGDIFLNGSNY